MKIVLLGGSGFLGRELIFGLRHGLIEPNEDLDIVIASRSYPSETFLKPCTNIRSLSWTYYDKSQWGDARVLGEGDLLIDAAMSSRPTDYSVSFNYERESDIHSYSSSLPYFDRYVYISSGAVYGKFKTPYYPKEDEANTVEAHARRGALSPEKQRYVQQKLCDEGFLKQLSESCGFNTLPKMSILRLYAVAPLANDISKHFALCDFLRSASEGKITYEAAGHVYRSLIMSNVFWAIVIKQTMGLAGELGHYNICSPGVVSLYDCAKAISQEMKADMSAPKFDSEKIVDFYGGDSSLLWGLEPASKLLVGFCLEEWLHQYRLLHES